MDLSIHPCISVIYLKMMHRSELLPQGRFGAAKSASGVSEKGKELSKSSVSSKCLTTEETLQGQIVQLKEKAHQSFMQVIQMQQLHEEQLELLRSEFAERELQFQSREAELQSRIAVLQGGRGQLESRVEQLEELQLRVKQLQFQNATLERNYKHHNCDFEQDELEIDNIELITCREESKLDDSAIINFAEIIGLNKHQEQMRTLADEIRREVETLTPRPYSQTALAKMVEKLFEYISYVRAQLIRLQGEREREIAESRDIQAGKFYQSLQKETKFMTEHIKRLSGEKLKLEKRLLEEERHAKTQEEKIRKLESSLAKRGIKVEESVPKSPPHQEQQRSLEIDQFISESLKTTSNPVHKAHYGLLRKTNKN